MEEGRDSTDWIHSIKRKNCIKCGACIDQCPNHALSMRGKSYDTATLMEVVMQDKLYYDNSGGGLTVSGGEPMMWFEFLKELLIEARKQGVHTCIETCGYASSAHFMAIAPYVDLCLFDYKVTDPELHMTLTGMDNQLILHNLKLLNDRGTSLILRCPLISGLNDGNEHLKAICDLSMRYDSIKGVQVMPYHNLGKNKGDMIGLQLGYVGDNTSEETIIGWHEQLRSMGCKKLIAT